MLLHYRLAKNLLNNGQIQIIFFLHVIIICAGILIDTYRQKRPLKRDKPWEQDGKEEKEGKLPEAALFQQKAKRDKNQY